MRSVALALALSLQSYGAIAIIGNTKASASASSTATTGSVTTTGATLIIAVAAMYSKSACTGTVSDSKSNTYTALTNYATGNSNICVWYKVAPTVGTGHTFSLNPNGSGYPLIMVSWWSGTATSSPVDQQSGGTASATTVQPGSITPSEANCLVITGLSNNSATVPTVSAPFSPLTDSSQNTSMETGGWSYEIQTAATARNPTWTTTADTTAKAAVIVSFKSAGAPPASGTSGRGFIL